MRIGIIGAGNVGGTLGAGWAAKGHEIAFGVRSPGDMKVTTLLASIGGKVRAGTVPEAAEFGEVVVLATPWDRTEDAVRACGNLTGKAVLDTTNPLKPDLSGFAVGEDDSGGERVARWARGSRVVKIFNTTGSDNMANPRYAEGAVTMFLCGDDAGAKATAATLASDLGFDPVDAGPLSASRLLEPLAMLWVTLAYPRGMGRDIAFRLMRRG
jgi:hypothetical protein